MLETLSGPKVMGGYGEKTKKRKEQWKDNIRKLMVEQGGFLYVIAFLLGRAVVLQLLSPFVLAFLASIWLLRREKVRPIMLIMVASSLTITGQHSFYIATATLTFILFAAIFKSFKGQHKIVPIIVFFSSLLPRLTSYALFEELNVFQWVLAATEATLSAVLVLIFMQSVPLLSPKRYNPALKHEEVISLIILLGSLLTGMIGWEILGADVEQIASRYLVLWLSFIGGAAIGSTVGVVAGLILSLASVGSVYQMSLLAFGGLLGGLLKEWEKIGVSLGLFIGTVLLGIYGGGSIVLTSSLLETSFAVGLFLLTPVRWIRVMSRYIPGTSEHAKEQQLYVQKVRDATANRMEQFSDVFQALSKSFEIQKTQEQETRVQEEKELDYFLSNVTERTCQNCFKKEWCWAQHFDKTYDLMNEVKEDLECNQAPNKLLHTKFSNHCVKSKKIYEVMKEELSYYEANQKLKKQVGESRRFVADQLLGVSEVMGDFAKEIVKERENHEKQEMEIIAALKQMGFEILKLDIYSLKKGNIDIEMDLSVFQYHGEGQKIIAPLLSDILQETIVVKTEEVSPLPNGYCHLYFTSAKRYVVNVGVAHAAMGGGFISGDSYSTMELSSGKYALAISDGMGNGTRAHEESTETLRLLQQILQSGIDEHVAIKSINSILSLRTNDEIFSTLDLAVIDLHHAGVQFLKIGSTPSFVKQGSQIRKVQASNLPIGIIQDVDVEVVHDQLKDGDILIMASDGIFDGPKHIENMDVWFKRKLKELETDNPQDIADILLEEVIRATEGAIVDDMTIVVSKVSKFQPKWATIPFYQSHAN
ncbi:Stage II sporulation protein E [Paraliobacillus sp. PM-2]|uniref:stage II sporulation protein E n=1 Tax=Paraliobacillus sp. PM-2 TaxID=1462524 RepID=UPI00061C3195|nr:stage II sporulation protein E [Paraliobacillus sp. PM-2]CQR47458.1 Stage II sporulation protein E [Paraliobacillus sp. PM-2]